jgi:UDP-glucose 4-epimerase
MRCLVTGGCGFIGSHLSEALCAAGHEVVVFDDLSTGRRENIAAIIGSVRLVIGDVRDFESVLEAACGVDCIFHMAALVSVVESVENPGKVHDINLTGTLNVLRAAAKAGVGRVIFASSCAVYGETQISPQAESLLPSPQSPYAVSKAASEQYMGVFAHIFGIKAVSLRYFNVYGPRQDPSSVYSGVISRFVMCMGRQKPPTVYGDGGQTRDFVHVDDVVAANLAAMESGNTWAGEILNIGTGRATTILELVDILSKALNCNVAPEFAPARPGEVRHSLADNSLAKKLLGFTPKFDIASGIERMLKYKGQGRGGLRQ